MGYDSSIPKFTKSLEDNNKAFLAAVGALGATSMKKRCPVGTSYGGSLRQDIDQTVDYNKNVVHMGNTLEYAIYVNKGTGQFTPGGRASAWVYYDPKSGQYYLTHGQKPQPYIQDGFDKIKGEVGALYQHIMKDLKGL